MYVLLTAYATLYPLQGWRDHGVSPLAYLVAPWPRRAGSFDIVVNVLGYVPFGLLCMTTLYPRLKGVAAFAVALAGGVALSVLLEAAQNYLPTRFASNVDVLANVSGAALGALLGLRAAPWLLEHGPYRRLRAAAFERGTGVDLGLVLLGLWLFTQLNPATLLFGTGDLRDLLAVPSTGRPRAPEYFVSIEAITAAANLVTVALLFSVLTAPGRPARAMFAGLVAAALGTKAFAFSLLRADAFVWLTPGAQDGLLAGLFLGLVAIALPRSARLGLAALLILATTVLVNLAPPNPYFTATLRVWHQGHFFNFNGLTRLVSAVWPFLALAYVFFLASRRPRPEE